MPKIVDAAKRREEILTRCFELFARRGYAAVTMREIAHEVGVSTGGLYHYFPTKNRLFQQMFQFMSRQDTRRVSQEMASDPNREARLQTLFRFLRRNRRYFHHALLMALDYYRHSDDPRSRRFVEEALSYYRQAIRQELDLRETGLEGLLLSFFLGTLIHQMLAPEGVDLSRHESSLGQIASALLSS
ncbi:MAG: TetR/AcrR family transcriptional regulator [Acidobacteriota bacterium]